jgi:hypothetical protein
VLDFSHASQILQVQHHSCADFVIYSVFFEHYQLISIVTHPPTYVPIQQLRHLCVRSLRNHWNKTGWLCLSLFVSALNEPWKNAWVLALVPHSTLAQWVVLHSRYINMYMCTCRYRSPTVESRANLCTNPTYNQTSHPLKSSTDHNHMAGRPWANIMWVIPINVTFNFDPLNVMRQAR